jgi:hypothetical protein
MQNGVYSTRPAQHDCVCAGFVICHMVWLGHPEYKVHPRPGSSVVRALGIYLGDLGEGLGSNPNMVTFLAHTSNLSGLHNPCDMVFARFPFFFFFLNGACHG